MVPTMIVFGLILGRWWWAALIAAAVLWPAWLVLGGAITAESGLLIPALYGVANAAVGVAVHQGVLAVVRRVRDHGRVGRTS